MKSKLKVLVVDDNHINVAILHEMLDDDFNVEHVQSGYGAIRKAGDSQPDVVLLDVMLPDMDGLEVCRRLRCDPQLQDTVIIMVSAKAMHSERAAGLSAGADDYLTKPFKEPELLQAVRRCTRNRYCRTDVARPATRMD